MADPKKKTEKPHATHADHDPAVQKAIDESGDSPTKRPQITYSRQGANGSIEQVDSVTHEVVSRFVPGAH